MLSPNRLTAVAATGEVVASLLVAHGLGPMALAMRHLVLPAIVSTIIGFHFPNNRFDFDQVLLSTPPLSLLTHLRFVLELFLDRRNGRLRGRHCSVAYFCRSCFDSRFDGRLKIAVFDLVASPLGTLMCLFIGVWSLLFVALAVATRRDPPRLVLAWFVARTRSCCRSSAVAVAVSRPLRPPRGL
jgi:hypothetical protein